MLGNDFISDVMSSVTGWTSQPEYLGLVISLALNVTLFICSSVLLLLAGRALRFERAELTAIVESVGSTCEQALEKLRRRRVSLASRTLSNVLLDGTIDVDVSALTARAYWPRQLGGLYVFIGLAGTVLAMFLALQHLSTVLQAPDATGAAAARTTTVEIDGGRTTLLSGPSNPRVAPQTGLDMEQSVREVIKAIRNLMNGLVAASAATLAGLLFTILAAFLNASYLSGCEKLRQALIDSAHTHFQPLYRSTQPGTEEADTALILRDAANRAVDVLQKIQHRFEYVSTAVSQTLERTAEVAHEVNTAADNLCARYEQALASNDAQAEQIQEVTRLITKISAALVTVSNKVSSVAGVLDRAIEAISNERTHLGDVATAAREAMSATETTVSDAAYTMGKEARLLRESLADHFVSQSRQLNEMVQSMADVPARLRDLLMVFDGVLQDVIAVVDPRHLREAVDLTKQELQEAARRVQEIDEAMQSLTQRLGEVAKELSLQASNVVHATDTLAKQIEQVRQHADQPRPKPEPARQPQAHKPWWIALYEALFGRGK